jgi:signal transduction histidine kinase
MLVEVVKETSTIERDQSVARMATQAVARLEDLILNIAQLHLIETVSLSPILLKDAVTQSINHLRRSWSYQNQVERVEFLLDSVPPVIGHYRAVSRLIYILIENALKFSKEKVEVRVNVLDAQNIKISVRDYGIGIAPEHHQQIFEAFYQVEQGSTRRFGGVGVGLALAQMLARSLNTMIHVDSQPQRGSTFWFMLPVADLA